MIHALKIQPKYFEVVRSEVKTFELRKNDRDFHVGDFLALNEWDGDRYTGRTELREVRYMLDVGDVIPGADDIVLMSIARNGSSNYDNEGAIR